MYNNEENFLSDHVLFGCLQALKVITTLEMLAIPKAIAIVGMEKSEIDFNEINVRNAL